VENLSDNRRSRCPPIRVPGATPTPALNTGAIRPNLGCDRRCLGSTALNLLFWVHDSAYGSVHQSSRLAQPYSSATCTFLRMPPEMPQRPQNHSQESWSSRAFAAVLPSAWLVHDQEGDYGIDHRVEIFTDERATGLEFNVQLKSSRTGSGERPAKPVKRSTLNYWEALANPTLIVIAHEPSQTLWFQWAHLLPWDEDAETQSRLIRCETVLSKEAAAQLADEVQAFRHARELARHFPVDVAISGDQFYGENASRLRISVSRQLSTLPSFVRVVHGQPGSPHFFAQIENERVMVGLRGSASRQLTWDLVGERDHQMIASDIMAALAFEAGRVGADDLHIRLLKLAAPHSQMLLSALAFGGAVGILARHGETSTLLELARRTVCVEGSFAGDMALTAFLANTSEGDGQMRRSISFALAEAARSWESPGIGLYNASAILGDADPATSLALIDEAGAADPSYKTRGYWWRERGTILWNLHQVNDAELCYREAVRLGEVSARPVLADLEMRSGQYRVARDSFGAAPIGEDARHAQWRLSHYAVDYIVEAMGIPEQARDAFASPMFEPDMTSDVSAQALDALRDDALNGWAHSALAQKANHEGDAKGFLYHSMAAAVTLNTVPDLWIDLLAAIMIDDDLSEVQKMNLTHDALVCAHRYCGAAFIEAVLEDENLPDEVRQPVIELYELTQPEPSPLTMRLHNENGFEAILVPRRRGIS